MVLEAKEHAEALTEPINITPVVFDVTFETIGEMKKQFSGLTIIPDDKKSYKAVTEAIGVIRPHRTAVERRRVELKADALKYGKKVDAAAKEIREALEEIENPLKAEKDKEDDKKAEKPCNCSV